MSIESEVNRLNNAKADLASAIEEYGVAVASDATLDEYGNLVRSISIPTELPNPNPLTFTGGAEGTYDGSEAVTVDIPENAVLLWEGAKASGANAVFNIAKSGGDTGCTGLGNLSDYKFFYVIVIGCIPYLMHLGETGGEPILLGGLLFYAAAEESLMVRGLRATIAGNTFTVSDHKVFKATTSATSDAKSNITAIYGIPSKEA